jgi:carbamoyltransferase
MNILGLSAFYHDSAAAVLRDGRVVAAAQEERFTRIKHDPSYPRHAIDACLAKAGLKPRDVDLVAFYEKPLLKLDRILDTTMSVAPRGLKRWNDALPTWILEKLRLQDTLGEHLGYAGRILHTGHHESHAASAFFPSPFEEAATLTTDGVGEWTTNAIGMGRGARLELLQEIRFPHSLGLLYSAFTQYLGFKVNNGEYKVMGLAPYGTPRFRDLILDRLLQVHEDGSYRLDLSYFDYLAGDSTIGPSFAALFGVPPRTAEGPVEQVHMDIARSIQAVTEHVVLKQARYVRELTGARNLCLAGGVALNSVANGKLIEAGIFDEVWIQPAAGDAGGALGAAWVAWHHVLGKPRQPAAPDAMSGALLGPSYSDDEAATAIAAAGLQATRLDERALMQQTARLLADGKVVGWHQGAMEFGPRALGGRTILADPRRVDMQPRVNAKIKFREGFRPFAPSVLEEHARDWFELDTTSPYMLLVVPLAQAHRKPVSAEDEQKQGLEKLWVDRSVVPAITHVDFSARVQTVSAATNPRYHALISAFYEATGCPMVLNTSFNLRGEPPVCTPADACRTFLASGMDALVIGDHLILRPAGVEATGICPPPPVFPPKERTLSDLRTFGVGGGVLMGLLAALQWRWDHTNVALAIAVFALCLALPGALAPAVLRPVELRFGAAGKVIGHYNGRLLLSLIYLLIVTPTGALRRLVSGDPLVDRRPTVGTGEWRTFTNHPDERDRYDRMF